jgi:hypothetical protein
MVMSRISVLYNNKGRKDDESGDCWYDETIIPKNIYDRGRRVFADDDPLACIPHSLEEVTTLVLAASCCTWHLEDDISVTESSLEGNCAVSCHYFM